MLLVRTLIEAVKDTLVFPAVPDEIYPADTCGVLLIVFEKVKELEAVVTDAPVPEIEAAGVAVPLDTALVAAAE